jgi:hypothetical protein
MAAEETRDSATDSGYRTATEPLQATVVHYRSAPDRCTVAPGDVSDERRLTAWLSVDADALVRLGEMR